MCTILVFQKDKRKGDSSDTQQINVKSQVDEAPERKGYRGGPIGANHY